jgi:hypothetical protein
MNLGPHQNYVSAVHHLLIIGIGTVLAAQVFLCAARPARCVIRLVPHLCGVNSTQDGVKTRCTQFALFFSSCLYILLSFLSVINLCRSFVPFLPPSFYLALFLASFLLCTFSIFSFFHSFFLAFFAVFIPSHSLYASRISSL